MRDLFYCVEAGRTEGRHRSIVEIAHERHQGLTRHRTRVPKEPPTSKAPHEAGLRTTCSHQLVQLNSTRRRTWCSEPALAATTRKLCNGREPARRVCRMEGEYTGHVKDGRVHGVGVCVYTDGSRYQGDWRAGLKDGRGTHSFASGDQFEGEWENGWMHGLGVYTWKIGDKYIGEVNFGRIHGFGTYTWRTNSKYAAETPPPPHTPAHLLCTSSLIAHRVVFPGTSGSGRTAGCTGMA